MTAAGRVVWKGRRRDGRETLGETEGKHWGTENAGRNARQRKRNERTGHVRRANSRRVRFPWKD